jgi:hypothetical protein
MVNYINLIVKGSSVTASYKAESMIEADVVIECSVELRGLKLKIIKNRLGSLREVHFDLVSPTEKYMNYKYV